LREWLAEPLALPKPHAAPLVRLAFLERRQPEARLASLHLYRGLLADELERAAAGSTAARRRRLLLLEAELAWADAEAASILAGRTLSVETR
jgi:hypothetical protein